MTVRDYFKNKYAKNAPEYLAGVLRTIGELPRDADDDELILTKEQMLESVQEK